MGVRLKFLSQSSVFAMLISARVAMHTHPSDPPVLRILVGPGLRLHPEVLGFQVFRPGRGIRVARSGLGTPGFPLSRAVREVPTFLWRLVKNHKPHCTLYCVRTRDRSTEI